MPLKYALSQQRRLSVKGRLAHAPSALSEGSISAGSVCVQGLSNNKVSQ